MTANAPGFTDEGWPDAALEDSDASLDRVAAMAGLAGEVHVDWRMTRAERDELRAVLTAARSCSEYLMRLWGEGKLDPLPPLPDAAEVARTTAAITGYARQQSPAGAR